MYGKNLSAADRAMLYAPSASLLTFRAFVTEYRRANPKATPNEAQVAYQLHMAKCR